MESSKDRLQQYIWPVDEPRSNSFHWQQAQYDLRCSELRQKQQELLGKSPAAAAGRATIDNSAKPFFFAWSKTKPENLILVGKQQSPDSFPKEKINAPEYPSPSWSEKPQEWQSEYYHRCMELKKAQNDLLEAHNKSVAGLPPVPQNDSPLFFAWTKHRENFIEEKRENINATQSSEDLAVEPTVEKHEVEPELPIYRDISRVSFIEDGHSNSRQPIPQYAEQQPLRRSKFESEYDETFQWPSRSDPFIHHHSPPPQISLQHIGEGELQRKDLIPHSSRPVNESTTHTSLPSSLPAGIIVLRDEDTPTFFAWAEKELQKIDVPPPKKSVSRQSHSEYVDSYVPWPLFPSEQIDRSSLNIFSDENPEPKASEYERNFKARQPHSPDSVAQLNDEVANSQPFKARQDASDGRKPSNFAWSILDEEEATVATGTEATVDSMQPIADFITQPAQDEAINDFGSSEYESRFSWPLGKVPLVVRKAPPTQISLSHDFKEKSKGSAADGESLHSAVSTSGIFPVQESRIPAGVQSRSPERSPNFYAWKPIPEVPNFRAALITPATVTDVCSTEYKERFTTLPLVLATAPVSRDSMGPVLFGDGGFDGATEYDTRFVRPESSSSSRSTTPMRHQHHIVSLPQTNLDRYNVPLPPTPEAPKAGKKLFPTEQNQNFIWHQAPIRSAPIKKKSSVDIGLNYPLPHSSNSIRSDSGSVSSPISTVSNREYGRTIRDIAMPPPPPAVIYQQDDRSSAVRSATSLSENTNRAIRFSESVVSVDSLAAPVDPSLKTFPSSTIASNTTVSSRSSDHSSSSLSSVEVISTTTSRVGDGEYKKAFANSLSSTASTVPLVRGPSMHQYSDFAKRNVAFKVPGSPDRGSMSQPGRSVSGPRSPLTASVGADSSSMSRTSSHSTVLKPANSSSQKLKLYSSSPSPKDYNPILMHKRYLGNQPGRWTTESRDSFRWKKPLGLKLK